MARDVDKLPRDDDRRDPSLDQAFFETDDPELRAFSQHQTARKVITLVLMLLAMIGGGVGVGWAIYHALR